MNKVKSSITHQCAEEEEQEQQSEEELRNVNNIEKIKISESKQHCIAKTDAKENIAHNQIWKESEWYKPHRNNYNYELTKNLHSKVNDKYQQTTQKCEDKIYNKITVEHNINLTRSSQLFEENVFLPLSMDEQEVVKHLDFFKQWYLLCHVCYILLLAVIGSTIFYWSEPNVNYVDALFVAMSTVCNCGLTTIDMSNWSTMTVFWRYILMLAGGVVLTSCLPSILRLFMLYKVWPVFRPHSEDSMSVSKLRRAKNKHACRLWRTSLICAFSTLLYFVIVNVTITLCMWIGNSTQLGLVQVISIAISTFHGCVFNPMNEYAEDRVMISCTMIACALGFTAFPIVLQHFFKLEWFMLRLLCRISHWHGVRFMFMRREQSIDDTTDTHPLLNENYLFHPDELIMESHSANKQIEESSIQRRKQVEYSHTMISNTNPEYALFTPEQNANAEHERLYSTDTSNDNNNNNDGNVNDKCHNFCNNINDNINIISNYINDKIFSKLDCNVHEKINLDSCYSFNQNEQKEEDTISQENKWNKRENFHYIPRTSSYNCNILQLHNDENDDYEESELYQDEVLTCLLNEWDAAFNDILSSDNPGAFHSFLFNSCEVHYLALTWVTLTLVQALPFWFPTWHSLLTKYSLSYKILLSICQAGVVRFAGITFLSIQEFSHGHVALTMFAMFIPALPISTDRTYRKWKQVFRTSVVRLLTSRLFWLFIAILTVIFNEEHIIEWRKDDQKFDIMTRVFFEVISAYANCGLSLSLDAEKHISFSGYCRPLSRIVIMLVIFGGRHRFVDLGIDLGFSSLQSQLEVSELVQESENAQRHTSR